MELMKKLLGDRGARFQSESSSEDGDSSSKDSEDKSVKSGSDSESSSESSSDHSGDRRRGRTRGEDSGDDSFSEFSDDHINRDALLMKQKREMVRMSQLALNSKSTRGLNSNSTVSSLSTLGLATPKFSTSSIINSFRSVKDVITFVRHSTPEQRVGMNLD